MSGLIDGGSSGSIGLDVVSAGGVFKDSGRKQNSRMVIPARTGAVAESRPASHGRKSSLFTSGPAALCGEHAAGPLFPVTLSPVSNASHAPEVAALGCATAWRFRATAHSPAAGSQPGAGLRTWERRMALCQHVRALQSAHP